MKSRQALYLSAATLALAASVSLATSAQAQTETLPPLPVADVSAVEADVADAAAGDAAVDALIVTARRRSENVQDVPVAITAISGVAIASAEQIKTANDITALVPNASASATDGRTRPRWFLRGVGTNDTGANTVSPIGIYNDDVYINNVYLQGFPLFDLDHVEVLRGPQGTLWGKNTTGGAVHIVSARPDLDELGGSLKVGAGSFESRLFQGVLNVPVLTDKLGFRLSVSHDERDGHVRNLYDGGKRGGYADRAIRGQLRWAPTDDLEIVFNLHARDLDGDKRVSNYFPDTQQAPPYNFGYVDPPGRDTINQADNNASEDLTSKGGSATVNWTFGDYTLTSVSAYEEGQRILTGGAAIPVPNLVSYATSDASQISQEVRLASPSEGRFSWILGGYFFKEDLEAGTTDGTVADIPVGTPGRRVKAYRTAPYTQGTTAYALFANATYNVTDRFNVTGGVRWSLEQKDFHLTEIVGTGAVSFSNPDRWWVPASVASPLSVTYDQKDEDEWTEVTYDITPQFKINENLTTYFRFAHGFRAGGFAVSGQNTINKIDPEVLDAYELGFKSEWFDRRLTFNAAAFYYDYSDIQVLVFAQVAGSPDPVPTLQNAGAGWVKGAEFEVVAQPIQGLRLNATLGLLKTEYTKFTTIVANAPADASGNEFARAPHVSTSLGAEYSFDAFGGEVTLGADWNYRTKQYFNAAIQNNPLLEQKAYGVGNARIGFVPGNGDWELAVTASNLGDLDYTVLATGPTSKAVRRVSGDPRIVLATITRRF